MKEQVVIFKNEMGKECKVVLSEKEGKGMKGAKNLPVSYKGIHVKFSSVDHNFETFLTKKELDKLRGLSGKFFKEVGKKSELKE